MQATFKLPNQRWRRSSRQHWGIDLLFIGLCIVATLDVQAQTPGITSTMIRIGAIMSLAGDSEIYGLNMKKGIETALANQTVQGRSVEFEALNNFDEPITTIEVARPLIDKGVFIMLGNTGTLTTLKFMPVLAANQIPALGFYTAGEIPTDGDMFNFRPGHVKEISTIVAAALDAGVKPAQLCLFAQNDADGLAAIEGLKTSLTKVPDTQSIIKPLDQSIDMMMGGINPALNNMGPVGLYLRGTVRLRDGYQSLKNWEKISGTPCRLVILVATPKVAADFIAYALYKNEPWLFTAVSMTAAGNALKNRLIENGLRQKILITQIVPPLDSPLPLIADAKTALGPQFNPVSLEGYIVGRLFLAITRSINGPLTRANLIKAARRQPFDLGGFKVDFTQGNPGSNLVLLTVLNADQYEPLSPEGLKTLLRN
jgi:branched-chain amino acid transport system substrate-binding protein